MEEEPRRRIRRRRAYSGTGVSDSSTSYGSVSGDEVDEAIDPDIDSQVAAIASNTGTQLRSDDLTPEERETRRASGSTYERELRLRLTQRMLMRDVPMHKIADKLNVSLKTVENYKKEIGQRMRDSASRMDLNEMIGDGMAFYNEVQAMGLRTASSQDTPTNMKLAALRTSLAAKNDMHRFMQAAGVFDVLRFKPKEQNDNDDIKQLVNATRSLLFGEDDQEQDEQHIHES